MLGKLTLTTIQNQRSGCPVRVGQKHCQLKPMPRAYIQFDRACALECRRGTKSCSISSCVAAPGKVRNDGLIKQVKLRDFPVIQCDEGIGSRDLS